MKISVVITSIASADNAVLQRFAADCKARACDFILVGDKKSPARFELEHCIFLDIDSQLRSSFSLAALLPFNHYARKNLGYLQAIQKGSTCIIESDDDNLPLPEFWSPPNAAVTGLLGPHDAWINPYPYFGCEPIYPRGYALNAKKHNDFSDLKTIVVEAPIQQYLSNGAPDIDARTRLVFGDDFYFENRPPLLLPQKSYCPFNSQNTRWFQPAFTLLYLPSYCSFRTTDIWRSFIAKRILDENELSISFHAPTVLQKRNAHDIYEDLDLEAENYLYNGSLVELLKLLSLKKGPEHYAHNLYVCYQMMVHEGFLPKEELPLVQAWLNDLNRCKN